MSFFLSVSDIARRLCLSEQSVRALIKEARLPAVWVCTPSGRSRIRVRAEEVEKLIQDPRLALCRICEKEMPWNAQSCQRCGWANPRAQ